MKLPAEVRAWLARRFERRHRDWLAADGAGPDWPLSIPLGLPTEAAALRQPEAVRAWAVAWRNWRGAGQVEWLERHWKMLGKQELPQALVLSDAGQAATWLGQQDRWRRALQRQQHMRELWPALGQRLARLYEVLADYDEVDFQRLQDLLAWLETHPASGLYPRQIPVAGLDSKWLEPRKALLVELLSALRGGEAGPADFHTVCGLARPPSMVRMRVLDPALRAHLGGLGEISAPVEQLARLAWQPSVVLVVENLQTGLALGDLPGTVAFMGLGYGVEALAPLDWMRRAACLYWGDIDTHGYAILHSARGHFPAMASVLMDQATLDRFLPLCATEKVAHGAAELALLTEAESALHRALKLNLHGQSLRLEQERIDWDYAWPLLVDDVTTAVRTPAHRP